MNNILIVEDEILELEFLESLTKDILSEKDRLLTCQSGAEAIKLARRYKPDIIMMDIMIPEIDGLKAIEEIRVFLPKTCIAILSAYSDFSYAQKAINLNIYKYLLKPIKPWTFKEVLQEMLDTTSECSSHTSEKFIDQNISPKNTQKCFIDKALKYIEENFKQKLTLEDVASMAFMNPKYFSRVFKDKTGTSFSSYVNNLKIKHACMLLKTTNYPAYRISMECGFSDPSYFNRVFSNKMDLTPMAYRKHSRSINV